MLKSLKGITDEGQRQLRGIVILFTVDTLGFLEMSSIVSLINLIGWEVSGINVGSQLGLEWGSDTSKSIKLDAAEELVGFDLTCSSTTKTIFGIADEAGRMLACVINGERDRNTF